MPISSRDGQPVWRHRTTRANLALWAGWLGLVALTVYC